MLYSKPYLCLLQNVLHVAEFAFIPSSIIFVFFISGPNSSTGLVYVRFVIVQTFRLIC